MDDKLTHTQDYWPLRVSTTQSIDSKAFKRRMLELVFNNYLLIKRSFPIFGVDPYVTDSAYIVNICM